MTRGKRAKLNAEVLLTNMSKKMDKVPSKMVRPTEIDLCDEFV